MIRQPSVTTDGMNPPLSITSGAHFIIAPSQILPPPQYHPSMSIGNVLRLTRVKEQVFFVFDFPLLVVCLLTPTCAELTIHHLTLDVFSLPDLKVWFQNRRAKFRKQERLTQQKSTDASAAGKESPGETKESRGCSSAGSSAESPHRDLDIKPQMGNFFFFKLKITNE